MTGHLAFECRRRLYCYARAASWVGGRSTIDDISIPSLRNTKAASVGRLRENAIVAILGRRHVQAVPKSREAMAAGLCHGAHAIGSAWARQGVSRDWEFARSALCCGWGARRGETRGDTRYREEETAYL